MKKIITIISLLHVMNSHAQDVFYFNRYTDKNNIERLVNGNVSTYGNVITITDGMSRETYFIEETLYDEDEQIYTFDIGDDKIVFDVPNKNIIVDDRVYRINSTIKTNW